MIAEYIAQSAINLTEELERRLITLVPTPGTPIAVLNELACFGDGPIVVENASEYLPDASFIQEQSAGFSTDNQSKHGFELEALATDIGAAVAKHMSFAKNTVKPTVSAFTEKLGKAFSAIPASVTADLTIRQVSLPSPMTFSAIEEMIAKYQNASYQPNERYLSLGERTAQEITDLLMTGDASIDAEILSWANGLESGRLSFAWDNVFSGKPTSTLSQIASKKDADYQLLVFLICNKLDGNPPANATTSLAVYTQTLFQIRNQAAYHLNEAYLIQTKRVSTKLLIISFTKKEIFVCASVYKEWIASGKTDAVIFGSALSHHPCYYVSEINLKVDEFTANWERQNSYLTTAHRLNSINSFKTAFLELLEKEIVAYRANNPEAVQVDYKDTLRVWVNTLTQSDFENLYVTATKAICNFLFPQTAAEKILLGIQDACEMNPGLSVDEAALLSQVEYIVDYICDQIDVVSIA